MKDLDFDSMSDEELAEMAGYGPKPSTGPAPTNQNPDFDSMSDEELFKMASHGGAPGVISKSAPYKSAGKAILEGGLWALDKVDSVTGAPTRAALDAAIDGKNPVSAFGKQFAEDTSKAPTGKTIAQKVGVSEDSLSESFPDLYNEDGEGWQLQKGGWGDITKSGAAGLGIDIAADWSNLVGTGLVRGAGKAAEKAAKVGKNLSISALENVGKIAAKGAAKGIDAVTSGTSGTEALQGLAKFVNPKVAEDFGRFSDIAKANGIDPSLLPASVEFGPATAISRLERNIAEGPIGEAKLIRHQQAAEAVQGAIEKRVSDISGGNVMDEIGAGQHLRDSFDRGVDRFFQDIDWTHNMVKAQAPGIALTGRGAAKLESKLVGIEKHAKGMMTRGLTNTQKEQGRQLMAAVEAIRNTNGSYKQIHEAQQMIGDVAFKAKNSLADIPPDVEKLRDIYFTIDDALIDATKSYLGKDIAQKLIDNNKAMSEFFGQKGVLSPVVGSKGLSNEQVFKSLVLNGDSRKIEALKKVLAPEDFKALQGAFLESLIKRNADGSFSVGRLRSAFQGKKNQLRSLFGDGSGLKDVDDLLELGERMGNPVLSSSGTGASNAFRELTKGVSDSIGSNVVLDKMKSAARNKSPLSFVDEATKISLPPPPKAPLTEAMLEFSPLADSKSAIGARIGAVGAKLSSTERANEAPGQKLIEQIDQNPQLLDKIKNPNLRRQIEAQVKKLREDRELNTFESQMNDNRDAQDSFIQGN